MGWSSNTAVVRLKLTYRNQQQLLCTIEEECREHDADDDRHGMFIHLQALLDRTGCQRDWRDSDEFGPRYASMYGPKFSRSDDSWCAVQETLLVSSHKQIMDAWTHYVCHDFDCIEHWVVVQSSSLLKCAMHNRDVDHVEIPDELEAVFWGMHEHQDGIWDTVIVKHTVV